MTIKKADRLKQEEELKEFYNFLGNSYITRKFICKKCNEIIDNKHIPHYNNCIGLGTLAKTLENIKHNNFKYSINCDMGCGNPSAYYHKNGKAYCCKLAAKCPIKIAKDKEKKDGINPWEGKPHPRGSLGKSSWCNGLTKENNQVLELSGKKISKSLIEYHKNNSFNHSQETKDKISKIAFARGYGGYQQGSGRGKSGWYKGFFCDSS